MSKPDNGGNIECREAGGAETCIFSVKVAAFTVCLIQKIDEQSSWTAEGRSNFGHVMVH